MKRKWTLQTRMILLIVGLMVVVVMPIGVIFYYMVADLVEQQIGKRALHVAETVAGMPEIRRAFDNPEPWTVIQPIAERVRKETGAEFVVVGNEHGVRYSHPIPERIGREMVGGDNAPALVHGRSYISKAVGSLGPSLRGKTPVFDEKGKVVGIVSVGFLLEDIQAIIDGYLMKIGGVLLSGLLIGVIGAAALARSLKKATLGLEPEEIASLFKERNAVIEAVREGIIVINREGVISLVNQAAFHILSLPKEADVVGRPVREVLPESRMMEVLYTGEPQLDREWVFRGKEIVVNRYPIRIQGKQGSQVVGAVSSFRLKSEMDELNRQLSQVSRYAEALRAQTHEFNNMLYTISGLIQLGSHQEALDLIRRETGEHQDLIQLLMKRLPDPWLGGILLGFHNRARELKVEFQIDRESRLQELPNHISRQSLVSILGNLITNAFEAVEGRPEGMRKVKLFLADWGEEILMEVEDSGTGVPEEIMPRLFTRGFSTKKGTKRGYGLAKVRELTQEMNGYVTMERGEWGGALFSVSLPKAPNASTPHTRKKEGNREDGTQDTGKVGSFGH